MLEYHPRMLKYKDTPHNRKVRDLMRVDPVDGKEDGSKKIIAGSHYWAVWEGIFFIQKAIEKSGWKSKKDTPDFIQALEGLAVEESFEHPQGDKVMPARFTFSTTDRPLTWKAGSHPATTSRKSRSRLAALRGGGFRRPGGAFGFRTWRRKGKTWAPIPPTQ
jgi:hypothetical protein